MMVQSSKYSFEPMFTKAGVTAPSASNRRKVLTDEDVAAAHAAGLAEGQQAELVKIEQATNEALRAIARMMQLMLGRLTDEAHSLRQDATEVALAAARSVTHAALDAYGADRVEAIVAAAVAHLRDTPRLVVRVSPELAETIEERLIGCAREAGFTGEIAVRPDPQALTGDCTLDWGDGRIVHDRASALAAIETSAQNWLASADAEGLSLDITQT
jgi:flagellar assembly protein FliH